MSESRVPEWLDGYFDKYDHKVAHGGRGSSKSWGFADALLIYALSGHERILCVREFQNSIGASVKRILDDLIRIRGLKDRFKSTKTEIICEETDSLFMFYGIKTNPDSVKSVEGVTKTWVEEAQNLSNDSIETLIPTVLRTSTSEIWWTFNRRHKTDPVDKLFFGEDSPPPDTLIKKVNFSDNPWFPEKLRKKMEWDKSRDYDKYRNVWLGEPVIHSEAQVFNGKWKVDNFIAPQDTIFYYGADWGFSVDPSALVRCYMDEENRKLFIDYEASGIGIEIDHLPGLFDCVPGARDWMITADCARPETISYMQRQGFKIQGSKKGKGSIIDGIEFIKSYEIIVHDRCVNTIDELSNYKYKLDKGGNPTPLLEDKKNHIIDSLRYALESSRKPKVIIC